MDLRAAHRVRWTLVGLCVVLWMVLLAFDIGGSWVFLLLVAAAALLVYELLIDDAAA